MTRHHKLKDGGNVAISRHRAGFRLSGWRRDGTWIEIIASDYQQLREHLAESDKQ